MSDQPRPPAELHLVVPIEGPLRAEVHAFTTVDDCRLADVLATRREEVLPQLPDLYDAALAMQAKRIADYAPADILPRDPAE